jgi:hypothetical protein
MNPESTFFAGLPIGNFGIFSMLAVSLLLSAESRPPYMDGKIELKTFREGKRRRRNVDENGKWLEGASARANNQIKKEVPPANGTPSSGFAFFQFNQLIKLAYKDR